MTMSSEQIVTLIGESLPGSEVETQDLTGTLDHWGIRITWPGFEGLSRLERHRRVMDILQPHMETGSGAIHAVQIQTVAEKPA